MILGNQNLSEACLELLFLAKWDVNFSLYSSFVHHADLSIFPVLLSAICPLSAVSSVTGACLV